MLFLATLQAVVPFEVVEVVPVLLLEGIIVEQCHDKLLCNPPDWFPTDQAEVRSKREATL